MEEKTNIKITDMIRIQDCTHTFTHTHLTLMYSSFYVIKLHEYYSILVLFTQKLHIKHGNIIQNTV